MEEIKDKKLKDLVDMLMNTKKMTLMEGAEKIGLENMPSMFDLAKINQYLFQVNLKENFPETFELLERQSNHEKEARYEFTNEFMGIAPKGHPAQGKKIMAKVDLVKIDNENYNPPPIKSIAAIIAPNTLNNWGMVVSPSNEKFTVIEDIAKQSFHQWAPKQCVNIGYIIDFIEKDGLIVPITDGSCVMGTKYDKSKDVKGFGRLCVWGDGLEPIVYTQRGWYNALGGFNANDPGYHFKIYDKKILNNILDK